MHLKNNIFSYKVYYEDTDAGGVVYYANYLRFLERARTDFLEIGGFSPKKLYDEGYFFAVKSVSGNYLKPVFYGEDIHIKVIVKEVRKTSFTLKYLISKDNMEVFNGETVLVCINKDFKIKKLPEEISLFLNKNHE